MVSYQISSALRGSAYDLGVFRAVLFATLAIFAATQFDLGWFAGLPVELQTPPVGTGWLVGLHLTPAAAEMLQWALVGCAALASVGLFTRATAIAATLLALVVLGLPELYGKLDHYHHLVWLAAILAASPCGDACSLDARRRHHSVRVADIAYGLPLRLTALIIGLIYLFPGLAKLAAGPIWFHPDNLRFMLYMQWADIGFIPTLRPDQFPLLLRIGEIGTVVFEIGFIVAVWTRLRPLLLVAGLGFHLMTWYFLRIDFWILQVCYASLVPWSRVLRRPVESARAASHWPWTTTICGGVVITGILVTGLFWIDSWPFGVYPRFNYRAQPVTDHFEIASTDGAFDASDALAAKFKTGRWSALIRRSIYGPPEERIRLTSGLITLIERETHREATITVDRVTVSTWPEDHGRVLDRQRVATIDVDR